MLTVLCLEISPRLQYIGQIVFTQLLNIPWQLKPLQNFRAAEEDRIINYTSQELKDHQCLQIPNVGLLFEKNIHTLDLQLYEEDILYLFFQPSPTSNTLNFDIFSAIFYIITEYEKYLHTHIDIHGRYIQNEYSTHRLHLEKYPLIHLYVEKLRKALQFRWVDLVFPPLKEYDYEITVDIDNPWKYLNKRAIVVGGGLLKSLVKGNFEEANERIHTILHQKDPNDTFDDIFSLCPSQKTSFFFLISRNSTHDSRFDLQNSAYQKLIRQIVNQGYNIGIHPSYTSYMDEDRIRFETESLAKFTNLEITLSRQHFLKYRLPHTFRYLEAVGIRDEYTICSFEKGGFPTGMAQPYLWYDLEQDRISQLTLHPTTIMDWSLRQYMNLTPEEAVDRCKKWIQTCKEIGGVFTFLFHNDSLSESGMWKGWSPYILKIIRLMKQ